MEYSEKKKRIKSDEEGVPDDDLRIILEAHLKAGFDLNTRSQAMRTNIMDHLIMTGRLNAKLLPVLIPQISTVKDAQKLF